MFYRQPFLQASANSIIAEEGSGHSDSGPSSGGSDNGKENPFGNVMDAFSSLSNVGGSSGSPFGGLGGSGNPFGGLGGSGNPFGVLSGSGSGGSGNPFSGFSSSFGFPSFGSRQGNILGPEFDKEINSDNESREVNENSKGERDSDSQSEEQPESRFFFSSLFNTRLTTCNYTIQVSLRRSLIYTLSIQKISGTA